MQSGSFTLSRRSILMAAAALSAKAMAATTSSVGKVPKGKMHIYQVGEQKSFDTLTMVERPIPTPGLGQALIRVDYAGIAARDQGIVMGLFPVPPGPRPQTLIPLSEGAGEVLAVGPGEGRIQPGDRQRTTSPMLAIRLMAGSVSTFCCRHQAWPSCLQIFYQNMLQLFQALA
jgi:threonine dehydrogenase-like Zn-dependent dehydrogenase